MFFVLIPRRSRRKQRRLEERRHQELLAATRGEEYVGPERRPRTLAGWLMRAARNH